MSVRYTPVEGIYPGYKERPYMWHDVVVCRDCYRVVGRIKDLRKLEEEGVTWTWLDVPPDLCSWCGYRLRSVERVGNFWAVDPAVARWHGTAGWWPSTWREGHWEVRGYPHLGRMAPSEGR